MSITLANHLSKRLRKLREKHKFTQEEIAERASLGVRYYQLLESGDPADIRLSTLERLAKAFHLPPSELIKS